MNAISSRFFIQILSLASGVSLFGGFLLVNTIPSMTEISFYQRESQTLLLIGAYFAILTILAVIKNISDIKNSTPK